MVLFFEKFSWVRFLLALPRIFRARAVYFMHPHPHHHETLPDFGRIIRLVRILFPRKPVGVLRHEDHPDVCFDANVAVPKFIAQKGWFLSSFGVVRLFRSLYKDELVLKGIQKGILGEVTESLYARMMANAISRRDGLQVSVFPRGLDWLDLAAGFQNVKIPSEFKTYVYILDSTRTLRWVFLYLGFLLTKGLPLTSGKRRALVSKKGTALPIPVKYAVQVQWQFHRDTFVLNEKRTRWDNAFLQDKDEFAGDTLLYSYFRSDRNMQADKAYLDRLGVQYTDEKALRPTLAYFFRDMLIPAVLLVFGILSQWPLGRSPASLTEAAVLLMKSIQRYGIFLLYYRPRVYLGFDDQESSNIARHIVFRRRGIKTAGVPHSSFGGPLIMKQLAFVSFDCIYANGRDWRRMFAPYWDDLKLEPVGSLKNDLISQSFQDTTRHQRFLDKYGTSRKKILVTPPGYGRQNLKTLMDEFYRGIQAVAERRADAVIIIRPRKVVHPGPNHRRMIQKGIDAGRIFFDFDDFDTWDLIAFSDLVVTANTSSIMMEAMAAGKWVFAFPFNGMGKRHPAYEYSPLLVALDMDDFVRLVDHYLDSSDPLDCYSDIQDGLTPLADGKGILRLRASLKQMAKEATPG